MVPQIAVNVSMSSLQWPVSRERGDKLVVAINVVKGKSHTLSLKPHEILGDALQLFTPLQLCPKPSKRHFHRVNYSEINLTRMISVNFFCGVIILDKGDCRPKYFFKLIFCIDVKLFSPEYWGFK